MASSEPVHDVTFEPLGRRGGCAPSRSLFELSRELGLELAGACGGHGHCGRCRVRISEGDVSEVTDAERQHLSEGELAGGLRLGCRTWPRGDCAVFVPPESLGAALRSQIEGRETIAVIEPLVRLVELELPAPSLEHPLADDVAVIAGLRRAGHVDAEHIDLAVLRELPTRLREQSRECSVALRGREVVAVLTPGSPALGLAFDLGTTGLAGYLVDLADGKVLAARGAINPQITFGEDVITRITHARTSPSAAETLRQAALEGLNRLARELCETAGVAPSDVLEAVVVGNTAMHHLLLGLPTQQLALAPFVPAAGHALTLNARDVGLALAPGASVYLPPNVAGFVGADHVAMLLATVDDWVGRNVLALDIGTNTEITLATAKGAMRSLSCPSGPAFEGYHVRDGMRATEGAIERVQIDEAHVGWQTIGGSQPAGICGSGIVDALAQLHLAGVLSANGRILLDSHPHVRERHGSREFMLVPAERAAGENAIALTQADVREVLLAKAAVQAGIGVLLANSELEADELDAVVIAGAFGSYLDIENAIAIGLLPALPPARFRQVGNAAGMGAKLALLSAAARVRAAELRERIVYLELASHASFARRYADSCLLRTVRERASA